MDRHGAKPSVIGRIAAWLAAQPVNAVLGMVVTLPLAPPVASAIAVQQTLVHGALPAGIRASLAVIMMLLSAAIVGAGSTGLAVGSAGFLTIGIVTGLVLKRTGSTTLTAQLALLTVLVLVTVLHGAGIPGPVVWETLAENIERWLAKGDGAEVAQFFDVMMSMLHEIALSGFWLATVIALYLGHSLAALMPGGSFREGRFRDLNLGQLMAGAMIVSCLVLAFVPTAVARAIAICLLVAFFVQGLALMHWFAARRPAGVSLLLAAYVALVMPFLNAIALSALSVVGYLDAWFGVRSRLAQSS
ncbi:MAG: hypothetical protein AAGC71_11455 [Pseudomonadota bacterium]